VSSTFLEVVTMTVDLGVSSASCLSTFFPGRWPATLGFTSHSCIHDKGNGDGGGGHGSRGIHKKAPRISLLCLSPSLAHSPPQSVSRSHGHRGRHTRRKDLQSHIQGHSTGQSQSHNKDSETSFFEFSWMVANPQQTFSRNVHHRDRAHITLQNHNHHSLSHSMAQSQSHSKGLETSWSELSLIWRRSRLKISSKSVHHRDRGHRGHSQAHSLQVHHIQGHNLHIRVHNQIQKVLGTSLILSH